MQIAPKPRVLGLIGGLLLTAAACAGGGARDRKSVV